MAQNDLVIRIKTLLEERGLKQATTGFSDLSKKTTESGNAAQTAFGKTRAGLESISQSLAGARKAFIAVQAAQGAFASLAGVQRLVDGYASVNARLKLATQSTLEFAQAQDSVRRIATATQADTAALASLYTRLAGAVREAGGSQADTARITEAVALSLKISGASAQESASAILQFGQALASGTLRGDEFNSVNEAAPRLMRALADALGRPVGELRALAENGELTVESIGKLTGQLDILRGEAAQIPATLGGAFQVFSNRIQEAVGQLDQASGFSRALAGAVLLVSDNLGAAGLAAASLSAAFVAAAAKVAGALGLGAVAAKLGGIVALMTGPVGIIAGLALAATAFFTFANKAERDLQRVIDKERELQKLERDDAAAKPGQARANQLALDLAERNKQIKAKQDELAILVRKQAGINGALFGTSASARIEIKAEIKTLEDARDRLQKEIAENAKATNLKATPTLSNALDGLVLRSRALADIEQQKNTVVAAFDAAILKSQRAQDGRDKQLIAERAEALAALEEKRAAILKPKSSGSPRNQDAEKRRIAAAAAREADAITAARTSLAETLAAQADRLADDDLKRALARTEAEFKGKKRTAEAYYRELVRLQEVQASREIAALERQRDAAANEAAGFAGAGDTAGVLRASETVAKLNTDIAIAKRGVADLQLSAAAALGEAQRAQAADAISAIETAFAAAQKKLADIRARLDAEVGVGLKTEAQATAELRRESAATAQTLQTQLVPAIKAAIAAAPDGAFVEAFRRMLAEIDALAGTRAKTPLDGAIAGVQGYLDTLDDTFGQVRDAVGSAFKGMEDALVGFVTTGKLNFRSFADSVIADLLRIAVQQSITKPLGNAFAAALGNFLPFAKGGVPGGGIDAYRNQILNRPTFFAFANGGVPRLGVAGEAGAEAILPLRRGRGGVLGVEASGGANVTVNVINQAGAQVTQRERQDGQGNRIIDVMIEQVKRAVAGDIARGGGAIPSAMESAYGLNRGAGAY